MSVMKRILIAGTGPTSVQMAVSLKTHLNCCVGIAGRQSVRSDPFFAEVKKNNHVLRADIQNEQHRKLQGECCIDHVFHGYGSIHGEWDTVILSVTADAYIEVLTQLKDELLHQLRCVVLLSPTFGSCALVRGFMMERHSDAEVISFSTYLGDTRWAQGCPSNHVITTAVKRKVFIGSTHAPSFHLEKFGELFGQLGIALEVMKSPIEAETRNISLYVHPPLFMNEFSLGIIFGGDLPSRKYVYKLFPEGPITQGLIRSMLTLWKEISAVIGKLNLEGVNLLKFMTDDNYPVRPESLTRHDIDQFMHLEAIHQEYLLYVRYASLLIDPFSEPDPDGRYFDFSAVPIPRIFSNKEGLWDIPRMPKEDYYRLKIIQGIARHLDSACPAIDHFIGIYERTISETALSLGGEPLSEAFVVQSFDKDIKRICKEIQHWRNEHVEK
ncbi:opine metallophore biosynthesis dehydrogenase [Paenibacillus sp. YPG26]|uniref:opine metallophore biosynthesis dehydrogenase n=1 Tax=Paenibacillus sp. YPG26 TaxID=2878915 RepID=UPI00203B45B7|nr:opine metallophore biosynthesis dehydrogenase [Paenibacillus sp. YPG26]USB31757.1 opine metallophore biosynthesis dehydrogenase [Paenibacillus sp. YPG26]